MGDYLDIIRRVIEEHQAIRGHIKLVGETMPDREALASLEKARADWVPGRPKVPAETRDKLQQAIAELDAGIKNHFAFEGKSLPPLLGELFMQAILLDHREITIALKEGKAVAAEIKLEGLTREELLARESQIQEMINKIVGLIEEHVKREETLLDMLQRVLELKERNK